MPYSTKEKRRSFEKDYFSRPHVKKKRAEYDRRAYFDPILGARKHARQVTNRAIASGKLKRLACEQCGEIKTDAHHPDYSKPLKVVWLCRVCHRLKH